MTNIISELQIFVCKMLEWLSNTNDIHTSVSILFYSILLNGHIRVDWVCKRFSAKVPSELVLCYCSTYFVCRACRLRGVCSTTDFGRPNNRVTLAWPQHFYEWGLCENCRFANGTLLDWISYYVHTCRRVHPESHTNMNCGHQMQCK